jgi:uncharacterized SAM-binding protein YcdF (DUF218 family)
MVDWVIARKVIAAVVLPPTGPLLVAILGLGLLRWRRRTGLTLAWLGIGALVLLSLPIVSWWLVSTIGGAVPFDASRAADAQAVVILGGGVRQDAADYGGDTLGILTLERVRYGAYVARKTGLPVLVTGGVVWDGEAEAELMKDALQDEFRLPVRWVEPKSRSTHENARNSAVVLKADNISRIILVTHVVDARRARLEFEAAGLRVAVAATGEGQPSSEPLHAMDFVPSARALQNSYFACYELLGIAVFHLFGP